MDGEEVKKIREKLEFTREEFSKFLCLSGYQSIANIETDFRKPNRFAMKVLRHLDAISKTKAVALIKEMNRHDS
jgi:DNA-binding transcriptional regulator YiaG